MFQLNVVVAIILLSMRREGRGMDGPFLYMSDVRRTDETRSVQKIPITWPHTGQTQRGSQYDRHDFTGLLHKNQYMKHDTTTMSQRICHFKLVLLGDTAVGKSCLVVRFVRDEFFDFQEPTIGGKHQRNNIPSVPVVNSCRIYVMCHLTRDNILTNSCLPSLLSAAFLTQTVALDDATVKFEIWDTAGQERYRSLAPMYYRGAAAAIVVYDITNPDSFTGAKGWVKELQRRGDPNVVIALAGNKADLESRRKVQFEEANAYAEENGILHLETSAKNANNVKALFVQIANKLPKNPPQSERESFPITAPQQESRSCC